MYHHRAQLQILLVFTDRGLSHRSVDRGRASVGVKGGLWPRGPGHAWHCSWAVCPQPCRDRATRPSRPCWSQATGRRLRCFLYGAEGRTGAP